MIFKFLLDSSDERVGDLQILNSLIHRKDQMLYKNCYISLIFQKLWNSFDLNESGHVSLSETQRVSSELNVVCDTSPPVINCGCKNNGINKSYRRTFRIYRKVYIF